MKEHGSIGLEGQMDTRGVMGKGNPVLLGDQVGCQGDWCGTTVRVIPFFLVEKPEAGLRRKGVVNVTLSL